MIIDNDFWEQIAQGRLSPQTAIAQLQRIGHTPAEARELVFMALGGSDLVETGADGVERYPSGKTVDEIERAMKF